MGFEDRARKCCERNDFVRAVIVLVEGLKRHPQRASSLEFLLNVYTQDCDHPGLERDILDALVRQPDCGSLVGQVCVLLEEQGKHTMARSLIQQTRERRVEIIWPPPPVELPPPEPISDEPVLSSTEPDYEDDEPVDSHGVESVANNQSPPHDPSTEVEQRKPTSPDAPAFDKNQDDDRIIDSPLAHLATAVPRLRANISAEIQAAKNAVAEVDTSSEQRLFIRNEHVTSHQNRTERGRTIRKKSADNTPSYTKNSRIAAIVVAAVLLALIAGVALHRWDDVRVSSRINRIDAMLTHFDPENFQAFEDSIQETVSSTVGESRPLTERRQFAAAVRNIESRPYTTEKPADEPISHWGAGALVLWAIENNDIERALSETVKLEFTHPDSLSALWIRARLMEHMGDNNAARKHYQQTAQQFPHFIPTYLGLARLAARNFDIPGWDKARNSLVKLSSKHSYHRLKLDTALDEVLFSRTTQQDVEAAKQRIQVAENAINHGRFYAAMSKYNLALDALANDEFDTARTLAQQAVEHDPALRIARVLLGALEALDQDIVAANETFLRAIVSDANLQNTSIELRLLVQYIAPITLSASGRADIALSFTTNAGAASNNPGESVGHSPSQIDEMIKELQTRRPVALDFNAADHIDNDPFANKALLARAFTCNALGASAFVKEALSTLNEDSADAQRAAFQRFVASVTNNHHQDARRQIDRMLDESAEKHTAEALVAHLEARFSDAIEHANAAYAARPDDIRALRPLVLSLIESGKGREAVTILEHSRLAPIWRVDFDALKTRVYARMGMREMLTPEVLEQFKDGSSPPKKYGINQQIDQLSTALWLRQNNTARDLIANLPVEPDHPEWKWTAGLYFRGIGDQDRAAAMFKKSWRKDQNKPELLVELGSIHLEFERYELAQEAFYSAILRDRTNIQALSGISQAYLAHDRARGRRDLARMLTNIGTAPQFGPQRAELRKWLAVLHGLREGEPDALPFLEKAQQEVGERADLLIELARYHEARDEFAIARIHYANALQKNSTSPEAHYGLAQMAIHAHDYRVARDHLKRFIALTPTGKIQDEAQAQLVQIQNKPVQ